jgi:uncharacterized membrane protein SirB2
LIDATMGLFATQSTNGRRLPEHRSGRIGVTVLAVYYSEIKWLHVGCALVSGSVFLSRGLLMLRDSRYANHRLLAKLSYCIDTLLLGSAVLLMIIIRQYPLVQAWLTVKVLLVVAYICLGVFALRRGKTRSRRAGFLAAAVVVYGLIIGVAVSHGVLGIFSSSQVPTHAGPPA